MIILLFNIRLKKVSPKKMDEKTYNTVVIAGGASKCIAALGALYYLNEREKLDFVINYAGTSAGGMICCLLSIGYTPFEIIAFLCRSAFIEEFQSINLAGIIEQKGLINYYTIQEYIERLIINKIGFLPTFRDIKTRFGKNLTLVTYNMTKNKVEYLNAETYPDMPVLIGLRMTVAVPLLFERFFYNNCEYVDGGLIDNFPAGYYDKPGNVTIGLNINPHDQLASRKQNYISYLLRIAMVPYMYFNTRRTYSEGVDVIDINAGITTFDFSMDITKRLNIFSAGYQATKAKFEPKPEVRHVEPSKEEDHKEITSDHDLREKITVAVTSPVEKAPEPEKAPNQAHPVAPDTVADPSAPKDQ